jgi:hypothetical protein
VGPEEIQDEVLAAAAEAGFAITASQLARRHRQGLLPAPTQRSRGRGGGRGTVTVYPPGTGARLVTVCTLGRKYRRFDDLAWALWWDGHELCDLTVVRLRLERVVEEFFGEQARLVGPDGTLTEEAELALDKAHRTRFNRSLRWARRRVGADDFGLFLSLLISAMTGGGGGIDDDNASLLDRGLGLDRARTDTLGGTGPWLPGDIREDLAPVGELFDQAVLTAAARLPDDELSRLRDDARALLTMFVDLGTVLRPTLDRYAFGLAHFGALAEDALSTPDAQAMMLALVGALCEVGLRAGLDENLKNAPAARQSARYYRVLVAVREAFPEAADALSDRKYGAAMSDPVAAAALHAEIVRLRESHGELIHALLAAEGLIEDPVEKADFQAQMQTGDDGLS